MKIIRKTFELYDNDFDFDRLNEELKDSRSIIMVPAPYNRDKNGDPTLILVYAVMPEGGANE